MRVYKIYIIGEREVLVFGKKKTTTDETKKITENFNLKELKKNPV